MTKNENLLRLIDEINSDPEKIEAFSKKESPQALYDYCVSVVPGYTYEEFTDFMISLADLISQDLSDEELSNISGGTAHPNHKWLNEVAKKFKNLC